jgi:transposase
MLEALVAGERDPEALAQLARGRLRAKHQELTFALVGRFDEHHGLMVRELLRHIDHIDAAIARLDAAVVEIAAPHGDDLERLATIPGIGRRSAEVVLAEIGPDMSQFPSAGHLASWAGICPGNNESAGKNLSGRTRRGDVWLRDTLIECAWSAARTKDTYLSAQFWHLARRIGRQKATVAVAHSILVIAYHVLADKVGYRELGGDYFAKRADTHQLERRLVRRLEQLGNRVTLEPATA